METRSSYNPQGDPEDENGGPTGSTHEAHTLSHHRRCSWPRGVSESGTRCDPKSKEEGILRHAVTMPAGSSPGPQESRKARRGKNPRTVRRQTSSAFQAGGSRRARAGPRPRAGREPRAPAPAGRKGHSRPRGPGAAGGPEPVLGMPRSVDRFPGGKSAQTKHRKNTMAHFSATASLEEALLKAGRPVSTSGVTRQRAEPARREGSLLRGGSPGGPAGGQRGMDAGGRRGVSRHVNTGP